MKPRDKLIKNLTSSKFQICVWVEFFLTLALFVSLFLRSGWEVVASIVGGMVTTAGYYAKQRVKQNIDFEQLNLQRLKEP